MAIRGKDEETKNGMKIVTNMDGEIRANNKLNSMMAKLTKIQKAAIRKKKKIADATGGAINVKEIVTDNAFKAGENKKEPATAQEVNMYLKELLDKEFPKVTGPTRPK